MIRCSPETPLEDLRSQPSKAALAPFAGHSNLTRNSTRSRLAALEPADPAVHAMRKRRGIWQSGGARNTASRLLGRENPRLRSRQSKPAIGQPGAGNALTAGSKRISQSSAVPSMATSAAKLRATCVGESPIGKRSTASPTMSTSACWKPKAASAQSAESRKRNSNGGMLSPYPLTTITQRAKSATSSAITAIRGLHRSNKPNGSPKQKPTSFAIPSEAAA